MKSILIGNGANIQYGGSAYLNTSIIDRAMDNARNGRYEQDMKDAITPDELYQLFTLLRKALKEIIAGKYDRYAFIEDEKAALQDFHERYPSPGISIKKIGFEDYFLAMRLIWNKEGEAGEVAQAAKVGMERLFLDSIYNQGRLNTVHTSFPEKFVSFLDGYDTLFTVNYDSNVESATGREVEHLHGQFDVLEEVYDPGSFRNVFSDRPSDNFDIPDEYRHTYCNAIMDFTKNFQFNMGSRANSALQKMAALDTGNAEMENQIGVWRDSSNGIVRKMYEGCTAKLRNPALGFHEYPGAKLDNISDQMHFLGFSPGNDTHILKRVKENDRVDLIRYYYYSENEKQIVEKYFRGKQVECFDARDLWALFD